MARKLIFVETSDIGARYSAEAARRLGFDPVFLAQMKNYQADTRSQLCEARVLECDTRRAAQILQTLRMENVKDIAGIMTFLDSRLVPTLTAASLLGVNGPDPAVRHLKDKGRVAQLVPDFSPPTVNFHRDAVPFDRIDRMVADYGSVILKPTQTAGGIGNLTVSDENFDQIVSWIREVGSPEAFERGSWVAQALCHGNLVSVEGFVQDGVLHVLGFSGRRKIGLTESQISFPIDGELTEERRQQCVTALERLIQRSGFRHGYFHVEFILSSHGAVVIDANMGRLGGGSVGEQIADSFGLDPIDVFAHVILNSIFPEKPVTPLYAEPWIRTLGVLYGVPVRGMFEDLALPRLMRSRHTQILDTGQMVPEMGVNNWSWIGILSGPAHEVESAIRDTRVRHDGRWQAPCY